MKFIRKTKRQKEISYKEKWAKLIHIYGKKDDIPINIKERVKKFFRGKAEDPLA